MFLLPPELIDQNKLQARDKKLTSVTVIKNVETPFKLFGYIHHTHNAT